MAKQPKIVIFDGDILVRFFRSVALAYAQQMTTRSRWVEYNDSTVLNILYGMAPWKAKPGWVEVDVARPQEIANTVQMQAAHYLDSFLEKATQGAGPAMQYLLQLEQIRAASLESVRTVFASSNQINREVVHELGDAINNLKRIRASSEIILASALILTTGGAVLGASGALSGTMLAMAQAGATVSTATGIAAGGTATLATSAAGISTTGFIYSVSKAVIQSVTDVEGADVVSVAGNIVNKVGAETLKQGSQMASEKAALIAEADRAAGGKNAAEVKRLQEKIANLEKRIEKQTARPASGKNRAQNIRKAQNRIVKTGTAIAGHQTAAAKTLTNRVLAVGKGAAPFLGVLFAGNDFLNAKAEFDETFDE